MVDKDMRGLLYNLENTTHSRGRRISNSIAYGSGARVHNFVARDRISWMLSFSGALYSSCDNLPALTTRRLYSL